MAGHEPPDADLHPILRALDPLCREALRRVLMRDRADRDAISSGLLRYRDEYRDERGDEWPTLSSS